MARLVFSVLAPALLAVLCCAPAEPPSSDWPQLLGPNRDGKTTTQVVRTWGDDGPPVLWRRPVGDGLAAPSVVGDKLVLFHRLGDEEVVEARDTGTGKVLWSTGYPTDYRDDYGYDEGPRAPATIVDGVVYTCGAQGIVQALDLDTGQRRWLLDTREQFHPEKGPYGSNCPPLVANGKVMINIGAPDGAGIVALDAANGDLAWKATDRGASYSAPTMATIGGLQRALFFTRYGLVDIDPASGAVRAELRWRARSRATVNVATPLVIGERIFLSAAYGTGAVLLDVTEEGFVPVWSGDEMLSNHYATSIHHQGTLYGYHGRQPLVPALRAVDLESGAVLWSEERFGAGSVLLAGETLVILQERGELILADVSRDHFAPTARAKIFSGLVRAYPALANGILYARNKRRLIAVDLRPGRQ